MNFVSEKETLPQAPSDARRMTLAEIKQNNISIRHPYRAETANIIVVSEDGEPLKAVVGVI